MKTLLLFPAYMLIASFVFSQPAQIDTITTYLDRATGFNLETASGGGYKFGTGYFMSNLVTGETGLHYDGVGAATVKELLIWFGNVFINNTPDILTAKVYDVNADSMPNNVLGSGQLSASAINANPNTLTYTSISITTGGAISGDFFVSLEYASSDDTIGIMTSDPAGNDGLGEHRMRQKELILNQWRYPENIWFAAYDADAIMIPVLDIGSGTDEVYISGMRVKGAYPNPAQDHTNICFNLDKNMPVALKVFGLNGHIIFERPKETRQAGSNKIQIDTKACAAGIYYYTLTAGNKSVTGRFEVVR